MAKKNPFIGASEQSLQDPSSYIPVEEEELKHPFIGASNESIVSDNFPSSGILKIQGE